jgi:hypothetical protein
MATAMQQLYIRYWRLRPGKMAFGMNSFDTMATKFSATDARP